MARPPRRQVDAATRLRLVASSQEGVCPSCGGALSADSRLGTGRVDYGYFCSLECLARQHYRPEIGHGE